MKQPSVGKSCRIASMSTLGVTAVVASWLAVVPAAQGPGRPSARPADQPSEGSSRPPSGRPATAAATDWKHWGGDPGVSRYSSLAQITSANVSQLKPVWVYDPGTFGRSWEDTPLLVDGRLYIADPKTTDVVALAEAAAKRMSKAKLSLA